MPPAQPACEWSRSRRVRLDHIHVTKERPRGAPVVLPLSVTSSRRVLVRIHRDIICMHESPNRAARDAKLGRESAQRPLCPHQRADLLVLRRAQCALRRGRPMRISTMPLGRPAGRLQPQAPLTRLPAMRQPQEDIGPRAQVHDAMGNTSERRPHLVLEMSQAALTASRSLLSSPVLERPSRNWLTRVAASVLAA